MTYALGIDLGTSYTAAAIGRDGRMQMVELGSRAAAVPSVLFLNDDDTMLVGDAAARRAQSDPSRVAREFKRRIGDPAAILLGGSPWSPEALMARMLRWTVDVVTAREGAPPASLAVSHPANWGPFKLDLLAQAIALADLDVALTITEPEAAAIAYAAAERVEVGTIVAVYDLGGGTFDAAVLARSESGFEILGEPQGIERLGGVDFDQAVFAFVTDALDGAVEALDLNDPAALAALSRLRQECVEAKEALSSDTEASVVVALPGLHTEVRITRAELEAMIRPPLSDSIGALRRALRSAGVTAEDVGVVLLAGGSSRIPLVAELIGQEVGRPVAVDSHPKHAVALGAALALAGDLRAAVATSAVAGASPQTPTVEPVRTLSPMVEEEPRPAPVVAAAPEVATTAPPVVAAAVPLDGASVPLEPDPSSPAPEPSPQPLPATNGGSAPSTDRRSRRHSPALWVVGAAGAAALLVVLGLVFLLDGEEGGGADVRAVAATDDAAVGATECPPPGTPAVCIDEVTLDGDGRLLASFTTQNVDLASPIGGAFPADSLHALFFFDTIDPATGRVWGRNSPFGTPGGELAGFDGDDAPQTSKALCVLIQDDTGQVFARTGNCAPLPAGI